MGEEQAISIGAWGLIVYMWWFITTPYYRFHFLGVIHFERILVAVILLAILVGGAARGRKSGLTPLILMLFLWMLLSHFLSPYPDFPNSVHWLNNYWKVIFLYFLILMGLKSEKDLFSLAAAIAFISLLYQIQSWRDFMHGGSLVYQEGVVRIIGVWSGGGIGAGNAFGRLALVTCVYGFFLFEYTENRWVRHLMRAFIVLCCMTVIWSGTRGALYALIFYMLLRYWKKVFNVKVILVIVAVAFALNTWLPEQYKHRYLLSFSAFTPKTDIDSATDAQAVASAHARVKGLTDGFKLALEKPIFGFGPGASQVARMTIDSTVVLGQGSQMHNLYGQALAEIGFVGSAIFLLILGVYFGQLRRCDLSFLEDRRRRHYESFKRLAIHAPLVLLFYGFGDHSLYEYPWIVFFSTQVVFLNLVSQARRQQMPKKSMVGGYGYGARG